MFLENDMLGIDYIIPDFQYLIANRHMRGIVITHGHEDTLALSTTRSGVVRLQSHAHH
jgi:mRNA degradation ribonuclease J1/J2